MSASLIILIVAAAILLVLVVWFISMYNGLVSARNRVREAWSGIDVQLKRRSSLVPNLVETVKGYAAHEKETFENVTAARAQLDNARGVHDAAEANNKLTQSLRSLFAVAEAYPELRAQESFGALQTELSDLEEKIAYARQFYNGNVLSYNTKIESFPQVLVAGAMGFKSSEFFEAEEEARADVRVSFTS